MPTIKFSIETDAVIKRLELDEYDHYVGVGLDGGVGRKDLPAGYAGVALLYLRGTTGQTAKFKITQDMAGAEKVLAERNFIKITSASGQATATVAFAVQ